MQRGASLSLPGVWGPVETAVVPDRFVFTIASIQIHTLLECDFRFSSTQAVFPELRCEKPLLRFKVDSIATAALKLLRFKLNPIPSARPPQLRWLRW